MQSITTIIIQLSDDDDDDDIHENYVDIKVHVFWVVAPLGSYLLA